MPIDPLQYGLSTALGAYSTLYNQPQAQQGTTTNPNNATSNNTTSNNTTNTSNQLNLPNTLYNFNMPPAFNPANPGANLPYNVFGPRN